MSLKNIHKYFYLCAVFLVFIVSGGINSDASEMMISPIFPENQREGITDYFSLMVTPGQEQTIYFEVHNFEDRDVDMLFNIGNSYTSMYGSIEYGDIQDNSLKHPLREIAKIDEHVTIPPNTTAKVPVHLKIPSEPFSGIILGGVEVLEDPDMSRVGEGQFAAANRIRYVLPISLRENNDKVDPDIHLLDARADSIEDKNAIALTIQNSEPAIIDRFYVDAEITKKGSKEVLYKQKRKDMQMAPNSSFDYSVFLGTQPFKPGTYVAYITASAQGGYEWDLEKEFTITQEQADKFNRLSSLELEEDNNPFLLYLGIIIAVLVIAIVIYILIKRNKQKQIKRKKAKKIKK